MPAERCGNERLGRFDEPLSKVVGEVVVSVLGVYLMCDKPKGSHDEHEDHPFTDKARVVRWPDLKQGSPNLTKSVNNEKPQNAMTSARLEEKK